LSAVEVILAGNSSGSNSDSIGRADYEYRDESDAVISGGTGWIKLPHNSFCRTFNATPPEGAKSLRIIRNAQTIRLFKISVWTATAATTPTTQATNVTFSNVTANSMTIN